MKLRKKMNAYTLLFYPSLMQRKYIILKQVWFSVLRCAGLKHLTTLTHQNIKPTPKEYVFQD